jgi:hypothetical protein
LRKGHVRRIWPSAANSGSADRRQNWKPPPRPSTGCPWRWCNPGHALDALGSDVAGDAVVHLDQDETAVAAVFGVLLEYRVAGGAGTGEAVEDERILVGGDLQDALNQARGLGGDENVIGGGEID